VGELAAHGLGQGGCHTGEPDVDGLRQVVLEEAVSGEELAEQAGCEVFA
jgi:hypothetical protein